MTNEFKKYRPQYKERNITPIQYPARTVPPNTDPAGFAMAFSSKRRETQSQVPPVSQPMPYAEPGVSRASSPFLNVGNNFETNWGAVGNIPSEVYGSVEQNISVDPNHPMIDNNEFMEPMPLPRATNPYAVAPMRPALRVEEVAQPVYQPEPEPKSMPDVGEYVLLHSGDVVAIGDIKSIQDAAWSLLIESEALPNDITVMKRVEMNIGVFLGE
jgi:hypothetical protein